MKNLKTSLSAIALATLMATPAFAVTEGELLIWINSDKGYEGLAEVGRQFEEDTGVKVSVQFPESLESRFQQVAATGDGPDIIFWAHDRFGGYAEAGLLREVKPSKEFQEKLVDFSWDAVNYNGKLIGYPLAIEAISLIYNKDLLPEPPKTWEELPAIQANMKAQGKQTIMWDVKNAYFTWPIVSAGSYSFKKTENGHDAADVGINSEQARKNLAFLLDMKKKGIVDPGMDYANAESAFAKGDVAMTINGPWSWGNLDKAGLNYGVATFPTLDGNKSNPFVGILSAGISSASPNEDLAVEFIENYLFTDEALKTINNDKPLGAVTLKTFQNSLESDARIKSTMLNAENGEIMPAIPQMMTYWISEGAAIENALNGRQTVEDALTTAEKQILR
ncbi:MULTISPECIES: maltose/maltodextrin ABC transporter substrate-binding protein MalE [Vibrio]|uniref:Maltodextrin-binding protein n=1 Tax=Vibrio mediterranei TaxID=689 RepID=A0AAN1FKC9_9VIBR|nr:MULTISPECIES: maltose/maltodextrin ABC transporter substrate-binding protein MalE [Vibrio]ASI92208.1 maltose ABC transporter substrate-binding protein MalE [Vibrio mediterranei]MCF4172902.1 maltose/maltodextrin ABC transporter substrate-binding protein MalE [Vibrio sp. McD22-P3]MCG9789103.1 maltose/maltodextrin ABC transporter substrate-binding protein MalE [Vibrio mediterranei]NOH28442.1 maltose/maltodextrin ABC transporter substrate-binding protein MalE [Vibrio mediterranei]